MVGTCVVVGCKKESYPGCGLSFHRIPANEDEKKKWMAAMGISGKLSKYSALCSLHFRNGDYITQARKKLKPGVVPSRFPKVIPERKRIRPLDYIQLTVMNASEHRTSNGTPLKKIQTEINSPTKESSTLPKIKLQANYKISAQTKKFSIPPKTILQAKTSTQAKILSTSPKTHFKLKKILKQNNSQLTEK